MFRQEQRVLAMVWLPTLYVWLLKYSLSCQYAKTLHKMYKTKCEVKARWIS